MSGYESSNGSEEEVTMYRCRHCPGEQFTASERVLHRRQHKQQRVRGSSPTVTLFEEIPVRDEDSSIAESTPGPTSPKGTSGRPQQTRKKPEKPSHKKPSKKERRVRSDKKFDRHIEKVETNGG